MKWRRALAVLVATAPLAACVTPPDSATVLASAGGTGADDAYVVTSEAQENEILRLLGVTVERRVVRVIDGRPFHVLTVRARESGETRELWFDVSRFFRRDY